MLVYDGTKIEFMRSVELDTIAYEIEQNISKRVDFLISGYDKDEKGNVVIVELKQWENAERQSGICYAG